MDQFEYIRQNQATILRSLSHQTAFGNIRKAIENLPKTASVIGANSAFTSSSVNHIGSVVAEWPRLQAIDNLKIPEINENIVKLGAVIDQSALGVWARSEQAIKGRALAIKSLERMTSAITQAHSSIMKKQNEELSSYFNSFELPSVEIAQESEAILEGAVATLEEIFDRIEDQIPDIEAQMDTDGYSEATARATANIFERDDVDIHGIIQFLPFFLKQSRENGVTIMSLIVDYINNFASDYPNLTVQDKAALLNILQILAVVLIYIFTIIL